MLVSLADMKTYLGISGTTYDNFLTEQLTLVSDAIEAYTKRKFAQATWEEVLYSSDYAFNGKFKTYHFPIISVTSILDQDDVAIVGADDYRIHKPTGTITRKSGYFFGTEETKIRYVAGYATIPPLIQAAVKSLVSERYNKKVSGVDLNFGSDVQRISIPGAIAIDFDYSLQNNDRATAFGGILGSQLNNIDYFRSERALIGSTKLTYIETVP